MTDTPAVQPNLMSPEQATTELDRLTAEYRASNAPASADAAAQLAKLTSDPTWAEQFFSGAVDARRQFDQLTTAVANADITPSLIAGNAPTSPMELTIGNEAPIAAQMSAVNSLREAGLNDETISQILAGQPVSRQEQAMVRAAQAKLFSDSAWVQRYLAGGWEERRQATLMAAVLSADIPA
jgi:hypothetical protein